MPNSLVDIVPYSLNHLRQVFSRLNSVYLALFSIFPIARSVSSVNSIDGAVNGTDSCLTGFVKGATLKQNKVNQLVNLFARNF